MAFQYRNRNRKLKTSIAPTKAKSIGSGSDLDRRAGRQSDGYNGGWCLD